MRCSKQKIFAKLLARTARVEIFSDRKCCALLYSLFGNEIMSSAKFFNSLATDFGKKYLRSI